MNGDAVRRYKELAGVNTEAVRHMQEHDRKVTEQLLVRLADVELRLAKAIEREQMARFTVRVNWENAVDMLWPERWLHVGPQPDATTPPPGMDTHQADAEVSRAFDALREALRKPALLPRRQHDG